VGIGAGSSGVGRCVTTDGGCDDWLPADGELVRAEAPEEAPGDDFLTDSSKRSILDDPEANELTIPGAFASCGCELLRGGRGMITNPLLGNPAGIPDFESLTEAEVATVNIRWIPEASSLALITVPGGCGCTTGMISSDEDVFAADASPDALFGREIFNSTADEADEPEEPDDSVVSQSIPAIVALRFRIPDLSAFPNKQIH